MSDSDTLLDLLLRYEEAREQGAILTPEEVCVEHPELVAAFRQRLQELGRLQQFLAGSTEPETAPPATSGAGAMVAGHELLEVLGQGGTGVVYKARQPGLNRFVALKLLRSGPFSAPAHRARFKLEAEAIARLRHPNIVQVIQVGEHEGQPYLTLEFCPGGSLADQLKRDGPVAPRAAAECVRQLAGAIQAAHDGGIVHRDLKPANVLRDERGVLRVTDFGLAKDLGDSNVSLTGDLIMGTPAYMAPEQAEGRNREVGPLADVWALGGILYALLTGRPPFQGPSHHETLQFVLTSDPVPPRRLRREVPRDLETICLKCLEKDPARRYGSAQELADDLGRFLDGRPVVARPVGVLGQAWRFCKRYPVQVGLTAVVILSLAIGATAATLFGVEANRQAGVARDERDRANTLAGEKSKLAEEKSTLAGDKSALAEEKSLLAKEKAAEAERADRQRIRAESLLYAREVADIYRGWHEGWGLAAVADHLDRCSWQLLGWEHRYLRRLAVPTWTSYRSETSAVTVATFSPDGKLFLVGGGNDPANPATVSRGTLDLFEIATGLRLRTFAELKSAVVSATFRGDGGEILVACRDGSVLRYNPGADKPVTRWAAPGAPLHAAVYLGNERVALVAGDGLVAGCELASGKVVWKRQEDHRVSCVAGVNGQVVTGEQGTEGALVVLRDPATGEPAKSFTAPGRGVVQLWPAPGENILLARIAPPRASANETPGETIAWALDTGDVLYRIPAGPVALAPGGRIVTATVDGRLLTRDLRTGRERTTLQVLMHGGLTVTPPIGQPLRGGLMGAGLSVRPPGTFSTTVSSNELREGQPAKVAALAAHSDGKRFLVVTASGGALLLEDGEADLRYRHWTARLATWGDDGRELVFADPAGNVRRVDPGTGALLGETRAETTEMAVVPGALASAPRGVLLAVAVGGPVEGGRRGAGEVQLWDTETNRLSRRLSGAGGTVTRLGWSPDGRLLAGVRADGGLIVWDAGSGSVLVAPGPPPARAEAIVLSEPIFSPDGRVLAHESAPGQVRVFDPRTGRSEGAFAPGDRRGPFDPLSGAMAQLAFLDDRRLVAAGPNLATWDRAEGTLTGKVPLVRSTPLVTVDQPRRRLALFARLSEPGRLTRGGVQIRDLDGGKLLLDCADAPGEFTPRGLRFSPDGKLLAGSFERLFEGKTTSRVVVWETVTGKVALNPADLFIGVGSCAFAADGRSLFVSVANGQVARLDLKKGETIATLKPTSVVVPQIEALAAGRDGRVVTGTADGVVTLLEAGKSRRLGAFPGKITALALTTDAERLAVAAGDERMPNRLAVLTRAGNEVWSVTGSGWRQVAFVPGGNLLVTLTRAGLAQPVEVEIRDGATGQVRHQVRPPVPRPISFGVAPDGTWLRLFMENGSVFRVTLADGQVASELVLGGSVAAVTEDRHRQRLVTVPRDGLSRPVGPTLWNPENGQPLLTLDPVACGAVRSLAFSADGRFLLLAGERDAFVWEAALPAVQWPLACSGVARWSPAGNSVAAAVRYSEQAWSLSDAVTGKERRTLRDIPGRSVSLAFTADGSQLATLSTASGVGRLVLWGVESGTQRFARSLPVAPLGLAVQPQGQRIALVRSPHDQGGVLLLDGTTGQDMPAWPAGHTKPVLGVVYSPQGHLLTLGADGLALLRDDAGTELGAFRLETGAARCAAFVPGGRVIVAGGGSWFPGGLPRRDPGERGEVTVFEIASGRVVRRFTQGLRPVIALAVDVGSRRLAVGQEGEDTGGVVLCLDGESGREVARVVTETSIASLDFHPKDGRLLIGTSGQVIVRSLSHR
jgi:WD40 repeat protein/tRNA A-37 threonylcarbamoyl transferase component Bud32